MKPRRLQPAFYEKIWGHTVLEPWFPRTDRRIGEVWFTADPPLPILVKFLFTSERLSIQVHPDDAAGIPGKTEMWHILRAEPGAAIALGFRQPVTRERVHAAALSGAIETLVRWFPVQAGQSFFAPARTVHALGGGLALVEIQQNTDVTYRLYDYGRPRELHLEQALRVASLDCHPGPSTPQPLGCGRSLLASCRHFAAESLRLEDDFECEPGEAPFELWICVEGRGRIGEDPFRAGEVWLVERACGQVLMRPDAPAHFLKTRP